MSLLNIFKKKMDVKEQKDEGSVYHWEWLGNTGWERFEELSTILIESVFVNDPTGTLDFDFEDVPFAVDLQKMIMVNVNNPQDVRNIQRTSNTQSKKYNQKKFKWERSRKYLPLTLATAHFNPYKLQPFYDSLEESKRKKFFENMMNYGLEVTKGDTTDPFLLAIKDLEERSFDFCQEERELEKDKRKEEYEKEKLERLENKKKKEEEKSLEKKEEPLEDDLKLLEKHMEIGKEKLKDLNIKKEEKEEIITDKKEEPVEKKEDIIIEKEDLIIEKKEVKKEKKEFLNFFNKWKSEPIKYEMKKEKQFVTELVQETKEFIGMNEKYHGYFTLFLEDCLIERPFIDNYLNELLIIKYLDHDDKMINFEYEKLKFSVLFTSSKHQDLTFKIKSKDTFLKPIVKLVNSNIQKIKSYLTISNVLSLLLYEIHLKKEKKNKIESKKDVELNLEKDYLKVWGENSKFESNKLNQCFEYLEKQKKLLPEDLVLKRSGNPFIWLLSLRFPKNSLIYQELQAHSKKFDREETVELEIKFKYDFPETGPFIRIKEPRFIYGTGNITSQGTFSLNFLTNWNHFMSMDLAIHLIKKDLIESKPRVDMRVDKPYEVKPNWERKKMFEKRESKKEQLKKKVEKKELKKEKEKKEEEGEKEEKKEEKQEKEYLDDFVHEYFAFSGDFASRTFNSFYNHRLERANNLIFPKNSIFKLPNKNAEPLTFEIISEKTKCYCGVLEMSAPKKTVIVPNWLMKDLNIEEGSKIQLKSIQLPLCEFVTFQPLSKRFYKIKNTEMALTDTLRPFTTLHEGQVIPLSMGNVDMMLQVVSCKPSSAVRCQVARNQFLDLKLDFEPALDFDEEIFNQHPLSPLNKNSNSFKKTTNSPPKDVQEEKVLVKKDSLSTMELSKEDGIECENCKRSIHKQSIDVHKIHCKKNYFTCQKCNQVVKVLEKKQHDDNEHKIVECEICKEKMEYFKFKIHSETCKKVPCKYCLVEFEPLKIHSHQIKCCLIQDQCLECGNLCMRKYFLDHLNLCKKEETRFNKGLKFFGREEDYIEGEEEPNQVEEKEEVNQEDILPPQPLGQLTCSYCQESSMTKDQLTQHIIDKHPDDPEHLMETLNFLF